MSDAHTYQIKLEGHLDLQWTEWFDGWTVAHAKDGMTILTGLLPDQAALHGMFAKIRNLNLTLIAVNRISLEQKES